MNTARLSLIITALFVASSALAMDGSQLRIVDGDTVKIGRQRLRLLDIDAPEIDRPRCAAELRLGLISKARLASLLEGKEVEIRRHGRDPYGRPLVRLSVVGKDVGAELLEEGLALRWLPGRAAYEARAAHWCGGRP